MDITPFEWHDALRCVSITVALVSIFMLLKAWRKEGKTFDASERDVWFIFLIWCITTIIICVDGILNNLPFGPRAIGVITASTLTLVVLIRRDRRRANAPLVR